MWSSFVQNIWTFSRKPQSCNWKEAMVARGYSPTSPNRRLHTVVEISYFGTLVIFLKINALFMWNNWKPSNNVIAKSEVYSLVVALPLEWAWWSKLTQQLNRGQGCHPDVWCKNRFGDKNSNVLNWTTARTPMQCCQWFLPSCSTYKASVSASYIKYKPFYISRNSESTFCP